MNGGWESPQCGLRGQEILVCLVLQKVDDIPCERRHSGKWSTFLQRKIDMYVYIGIGESIIMITSSTNGSEGVYWWMDSQCIALLDHIPIYPCSIPRWIVHNENNTETVLDIYISTFDWKLLIIFQIRWKYLQNKIRLSE